MTDTHTDPTTTILSDRRAETTSTNTTTAADANSETSPGACTRCGRAGHTTTLEGAIVCRVCIAHANDEDTTRSIDQRGLERFE